MENKNRVLSRDRLLERVGATTGSSRPVRSTFMSRLRAKLGTVGTQIETVVGLGYRFAD